MLDRVQQDLLAVLSAKLFSADNTVEPDYAVFSASKKQAVFPLVAPYIGRQYVAKNLQILQAHCDMYALLSAHGIPCVIIKGWASSVYYPDPILRQLGDVDILVPLASRAQAGAVLLENGYTLNEECLKDDANPHHWGYEKDGIDHELHWQLNGAPEGPIGELVEAYLQDVYENARTVDTLAGAFKIPSDFHNGLIQLLHMARHMTSSGMGLRHLCDWALFVNSVEAFEEIFRPCFTAIGIWRFACLMTAVSVRYLGLKPQPWSSLPDFDDAFLETVLLDILGGGNFGTARSVYYSAQLLGNINTDGKTNSHGKLYNTIRTMNSISHSYIPLTKKCPLLLPFGWVYVTLQYLARVIRGKRKLLNPLKTISEAKGRERLYASFRLFEKESYRKM